MIGAGVVEPGVGDNGLDRALSDREERGFDPVHVKVSPVD